MSEYLDNMPNSDYHAHPAVSSTDLRNFMRSPAHYWSAKHGKREATPAMVFGSAFHLRVLEPHLFAERVVVEKTAPPKKRAEVEAAGHYLITLEDRDTIEAMVSSLEAHETAAALLWHPAAVYERSYFWERDGLPCKARPDVARTDMRVVVDLKTAVDASPSGFSKAIGNYGYHYQAAHYLGGVTDVEGDPWNIFIFVAVEKTAPYAVGVYRLDDEALSVARERLSGTYEAMRSHIAADEWPAYPDEIVEISVPRWAA